MTRKVVAIEGENVNNRIIAPGALRREDDFVPVVMLNGDGPSRILGKASKLERDGNAVTMEIEIYPQIAIDLEDGIDAFVYVRTLTGDRNSLIEGAPVTTVSDGRILEVCLFDSPS